MKFISKINIISIFLLAATVATAQDLPKPEIYFGVSGGATASKVSFSPSVSQNYLIGATGGAMFRYIAEKYFGLQAEINFSQIGWKEKVVKETNYIFSRRLNYIDIPFLTHIYFGDKTSIFVNLGPEIGFLIGQQGTAPAKSDAEQQIRNPQNNFDYGFALGAGFSAPFHKNAIQLEIRGYYGMGDIYSNQKKDYFDRSNNIKASVTLGYTFKYK